MSVRGVSTPMFRVSGASMATLMWGKHGWRPTMWLSAGVVMLSIAGALSDLRLVIIALMILLLGLPMVLGFLYLNYGLKRATALNMLEHRVVVSTVGGLSVEVAVKKDEDEDAAEIRTVNLAEAYHITANERGVIIDFKTDGMLTVPYSIWGDDKEAFTQWLDAVRAANVLPNGENCVNSQQ